VKTAGNTEDGTAAGCGLARIDVGAPAASSGDSPSGHHDSTHAIQGPRCGAPVARKITSPSLTYVRDIAAGRIVACGLSGEVGGGMRPYARRTADRASPFLFFDN
jgi:hypothetical protein